MLRVHSVVLELPPPNPMKRIWEVSCEVCRAPGTITTLLPSHCCHLLFSLPSPQTSTYTPRSPMCLTHSRCSINMCWMLFECWVSRISAKIVFLKRNTSRMQTSFSSPSRTNLHFPTPRCQGLEEKRALELFPSSQGERGNSHISKVLAGSGVTLCN